MYNSQLDTFLVVADSGSFTKAAKLLYITPSAVLQQINSLEKNLDTTLFLRGNTGLRLTEAGEYLYFQAQKLLEWNSSVRSALKQLDARASGVLRVGVPKMHKSVCFYELWTKYSASHHDMKIDFVEAAAPSGPNVGATYSSVDIIEFVQMPFSWQKDMQFLQLGYSSVVVGVPVNHPMYENENIKRHELSGQRIIACDGPFLEVVPDYINELEKCGAEITIVQAYTQSVLERCYVDGTLILLQDCSKNIHPGIKLIPCEVEKKLPYGFFYSASADNGANSFIKFVKDQLVSGDFTLSY